MKINRLLPSLALAAAFTTVSCGKLEDRINSLEQRIAELEDTKIPTIDAQVTSINRTIGDMEKTDAALKEYISALRSELTDAYTKLVATEITKLETSMKSWVNDKLAGYYTIEQTDAKLAAMKSELDGRIDSEKAYLVTLITNLETSTNKKIAANSSLITGATAENGVLSVTVATDALNKDFIIENLSASAAIKITSESKNAVSDYVKMTPTGNEIKFVKYLVDNFDTDGDGALNTEAVEAAKELKISGMNISSLKGVLEKMPNLEVLDCGKNQLTNIDVSKNINLLELDVKDNQLKELDVRNCGGLRFIDFSGNDKSITVEQKGFLVADQRWSLLNVGAYSTVDAGGSFYWDTAKTQCPDGWRLPTKKNLKIYPQIIQVIYTKEHMECGSQELGLIPVQFHPFFFHIEIQSEMDTEDIGLRRVRKLVTGIAYS